MSHFRLTKPMRAAVGVSVMLTASAALAAASESLYLLAGTASSNFFDVPVRLYHVDPGGGKATLVKEVARGLYCVFADYGDRVIAVASPALQSNEFSFIDMNAPDAVVTRRMKPYANQTLPGQMYLLKLPGIGLGVAFPLMKLDAATHRSEYPSGLTFVSLKSDGPQKDQPYEDLKYLQLSGEVGGAVSMLGNRVILRGDPLQVTLGPKSEINGVPAIGFQRPSYLAGRDLNDGFQLLINDDNRAVMMPAEPGVIDVLNKRSGEWRRIPIPFRTAVVRAFGPWLGMIEARSSGAIWPPGPAAAKREDVRVAHESPGAEKRREEEILPSYRQASAFTVEDLFDQMHAGGTYFPGVLAVMNLDTGVQTTIETGVGDSEVVLVTDNAVYYRVDDTLYSRQIVGANLGNPTVVAHGSEIVQVHWAFLN